MSGNDVDLSLLLARFDLEGYLAEHGATRESLHERMVQCPRCLADKLTVNLQHRVWRCFRCERRGGPADASGKRRVVSGGGGVWALVEWMEGTRGRATFKIIERWATPAPMSGVLPALHQRLPEVSVIKLPTGLPDGAIPVDGVLPYMLRRGITLEDARGFGLHWVPPGKRWLSNRLVFPVWERGSCLYWQARALWDESEHVPRGPEDRFRKSLNPAGERDGRHYLGSTDVLLNLEQAARYPRVAIAEGPTSAIRIGANAVATFGRTLSNQQIARLIAAGVRAVDFCWDGPTPGKAPQWNHHAACRCHGDLGCAWPAALEAAHRLAPFVPDVRVVFLPQGDPGDYPRHVIHQHLANARPLAAVSTAGVLR